MKVLKFLFEKRDIYSLVFLKYKPFIVIVNLPLSLYVVYFLYMFTAERVYLSKTFGMQNEEFTYVGLIQ